MSEEFKADSVIIDDINGIEPGAGGAGVGSDEKVKKKIEFNAEKISSGLMLISAALAARRGPHWVMSSAEALDIAEPLHEVMSDYLPDFDLDAKWILLYVVGQYSLPRIALDMQIAAQPKKEVKPDGEKSEPAENQPA